MCTPAGRCRPSRRHRRCRPRGGTAARPTRFGRASPGSPAAVGHGWRWSGRPRTRSPPPTRPDPVRQPGVHRCGAGPVGSMCGCGFKPTRVGSGRRRGLAGPARVRRHVASCPSPPRASSSGTAPAGRCQTVTNPDSAVAGCGAHHCAAARSLVRPACLRGPRPRRRGRAAAPRRGQRPRPDSRSTSSPTCQSKQSAQLSSVPELGLWRDCGEVLGSPLGLPEALGQPMFGRVTSAQIDAGRRLGSPRKDEAVRVTG